MNSQFVTENIEWYLENCVAICLQEDEEYYRSYFFFNKRLFEIL